MDPDQKAGFVQPQPGDPRAVTYRGRTMWRAAGGDGSEGVAGGEGGGGSDAQAGGLDELIDLGSVPEELRPHVDPIVKQIQGNVTKRFQEHADFRKQWEPFAGVEGLTDVPADDLKELLQFREIVGDPQQFDQWLTDGVLLAIAEADPGRFNAIFERVGNETGLISGDAGGEGEGGEQGGEMLDQLRSLLDERLKPLEERFNHQDSEQRVNEARQKLESDLDGVLPEGAGDEVRDAVKQLALRYDDAEAIKKAYQDYLKITGKAEADLVDTKLGQPGPAAGGGAPNGQVEEYGGFDDPNLRAGILARVRGG